MPRVITNARLTDGRVVDVEVDDTGSISAVRDHDPSRSPEDRRAGIERVDVDGWLLLPAMAEPHAHLDKALTAELVPNPTGDLRGAIEAWTDAAAGGTFTREGMVRRIRRALDLLVLNGVTAVRSHVNCGARAGTWHLEAAQEAVTPFAGIVDVQFVALTHSPIVGTGSAANQQALADALELGVDLLGGAPHLEQDGCAAMDYVLDLATEAGVAVDLHTDETLDPSTLDLRTLAQLVRGRGFDGGVTASHCVSLGMQPADVQDAVATEVAEAGVSVVTLPQTNLFLQGRDHRHAVPRGLTAIAPLTAAGTLVAAGGDNVQDPFNPVGRSDPLETAALLVAAGHVLPDDAYDMVSNRARRALGLRPVTLAVGDPADVVAIDAGSIRAAIADAPVDRRVFRGGRLVASSTSRRVVHR